MIVETVKFLGVGGEVYILCEGDEDPPFYTLKKEGEAIAWGSHPNRLEGDDFFASVQGQELFLGVLAALKEGASSRAYLRAPYREALPSQIHDRGMPHFVAMLRERATCDPVAQHALRQVEAGAGVDMVVAHIFAMLLDERCELQAKLVTQAAQQAPPPVIVPARRGLDTLVAVLGDPHGVTPAEACDDLRELGFDVPATLDRLMDTVQPRPTGCVLALPAAAGEAGVLVPPGGQTNA